MKVKVYLTVEVSDEWEWFIAAANLEAAIQEVAEEMDGTIIDAEWK